MALETSGFQLSQFERAPQIPGNIGVVDTKAIYGSVVDALKANEALRTTQAVQAATDAELVLARQKAQAETGLLEPESEARRAKAQLFTAGAPYEMGLIPTRAEAERAKLGYETALSRELGTSENIAALAKSKTLSSAARGVYDLARMAADPNASPEMRTAAGVKLKTIQDANQRFRTALDSGKVDFHTTNADGSTYVRFRDGSTGIIGYPETYTGNAAAYLSGPITAAGGLVPTGQVAATGAPAAGPVFAPPSGLLAGAGAPTIAGAEAGATLARPGGAIPRAQTKAGLLATVMDEKRQESLIRMNEKEYEDIRQRLDVSLPADERQLNSLKAKTQLVEKAIDEASQIVEKYSYLVTGPGEFIREKLPISVRKRFDSLSKTIRSNLGFDQLQEMRQNSKTGGALGNVSDTEGERLESTYGALSTEQSPDDLVTTLQTIKDARRDLVNRAESDYIAAKARTQVALARVRPDLVPAETPAQPAVDLSGAFAAPRSSLAPAQITLGAPAPAPAAPTPAAPLVPTETPTSRIREITPGTQITTRAPGPAIVITQDSAAPAAAPVPAPAPAPAAAPAPAPERAPNAPASPLLVDFVNRLREVNPEVVRRRQETAAQVGGTGYAAAGPFAKPAEPAQPAVAPASKYSWEQYNARRQRTTEQTGLPQISLSPQGVGIARELRSQYEAGQRAKQGEQPVVEITASDGKRRAFAVEDPEIADMLIGILTGQQPPNLEPRLEVDREATRRLGEERMRREELARQFRSMPRR